MKRSPNGWQLQSMHRRKNNSKVKNPEISVFEMRRRHLEKLRTYETIQRDYMRPVMR